MLTDTIHFDDGTVSADITVEAADSMLEFARWRCRNQAQQDRTLTPDLFMIRLWAYPDVYAAVTAGEIRRNGETSVLDRRHRLTFDLYRTLPDALMVEIEEAVYRCNPGWLVKPAEQQTDDLKKVTRNSTGG